MSCHLFGSCCHCAPALHRRRFLKGCGLAAASTLSAPNARANPAEQRRVRVAAVFLCSMNTREIWPYPGFDTHARQREVLAALTQALPEIEFVPVTLDHPAELNKAIELNASVDGYLVHVMTLDWAQRGCLVRLAQLNKPTLVADEFLGGSGAFLTGYAELCSRGVPAAALSSTRLDDLVALAGQFATVGQPDVTPESFAQRCQAVYRRTFAPVGAEPCLEDRLPAIDIGQCVERFRQARFVIVGAGQGGQERDFLGATGQYVNFDELQAIYDTIDGDQAAEWADRWRQRAVPLPEGQYVEPSRPQADAVDRAGGVYLATLELMKKYGADSITMNCLGGFSAGKLPAYPCLGFMQILDDGGQGVCEAMPDDTLSMIIARLLTGRPGFVSDPALDTSKNQIVYAHCVGTTKVFGPEGASNGYRIRTLHNRDPRGACAESLMPAGYMTTTFRTNVARRQLIMHQARSLGPLDAERGCRTKLIGEVCGDIEKLFDQWDQFGWHRVTVYGDVREPLIEFGKALGLEVLEEA